ncbi:MAG TPA: YheV family putative zinc ribbon protein [Moraxellaceae bacterium]
MTLRKQFIAGARCPRCNAEDRIRLCRDGEKEWLECVACGYESAEPQAPEHPNPPPEPAVGIVKFPGKS